MDIQKLIIKLRTESLYKGKATLEIMDLCMEAAEALERLNDFEQSPYANLLQKIAQLEAERDAAVEDLEIVCKTGGDACLVCTYNDHLNGCISSHAKNSINHDCVKHQDWFWRNPAQKGRGGWNSVVKTAASIVETVNPHRLQCAAIGTAMYWPMITATIMMK